MILPAPKRATTGFIAARILTPAMEVATPKTLA